MTEQDARQILGLDRGYSPEQVREAYRDLVKVWHPDRFVTDERLREKAVRRLQEINDAYALLQGDATPRASADDSDGDTTAPWDSEPTPAREADFARSAASRAPIVRLVAIGATIGIGVVAVITILLWPQLRATARDESSASAGVDPGAPQDVATAASAPHDINARSSPQFQRPESGTELVTSQRQGGSSLVVYNQSRHDGVVALIASNVSERAVYVRAGEQTTLANVAVGRYKVRMTLGTGWVANRFMRDATYQELEEQIEFLERDDERGTEFTRLTLSLQPVVAGMQGVRATAPFQVVR